VNFNMPYKVKGRTVYVKRDGWQKKATAKSPASAKRMVRLLYGVEHGWVPTGRPAKRTKKRSKGR